MKKLFFLLVGMVFIAKVNAQYFQTGQDPASIKWRQINTKDFQLIYPDYFEQQAQRLAFVMEKVYNYKYKTLKYKPRKISIILHTQTVNSNGLVAWAPKRSEFYTTPHQGIYAEDWLHQLAVHEFRHVVQIDKINSEIPKIIKILLGEQGTAAVFGLYFPWWYIEGDAVVMETALGKSGRGRFPSFLMEHRAQVVEKEVYKYDKAYNGSLKDYVPDHYQLRYYMVGGARHIYGSGIWDAVATRVGENPFSFIPVNRSLKRQTGLNKVELYKVVFDSLQNVWIKEDEAFKPFPSKVRSRKSRSYSNYNYPHWINDSTIVAYNTALNKIPSFVTIDNSGKEKKLFHPGYIFDESINYRGDWVVWSERIPDLRWSHSGRAQIRLYNCMTSEKFKIIPEHKGFAPSISPDLKNVAVVEADFSNNYFISVYNIRDGQLKHRIQTKNNNYFFSPEWVNEKELVAVMLTKNGKRLVGFNVENNAMKILVDRDLGEIKNLKCIDDELFFTSSYSGKNTIYVLNLKSKVIHQIIEPRFGAESATISPNGKRMAISDYEAQGFRILEVSLNDVEFSELTDVEKGTYELAENLAKQESGIIDLYESGPEYESRKYRKIAHLFNFHSWAPVSVNTDTYEFVPGVSFLSQNKLGTSFTQLGYEWDLSEKTGRVYGKYTFKGWYPVFDLQVNTGNRASQYRIIEDSNHGHNNAANQDTTLQRFKWRQTNLEFTTRLPLDLSRGKNSRLVQPEIIYQLSHYKHDGSTPEQFFSGNLQTLQYRLYLRQVLRKSVQDVFPDFGIVAEANYYHTPAGDADLGNMVLGQAYLFLPGVLLNHGIRCYAGIQKKQPYGSRSFNDVIRYPRGWNKLNSTDMYSLAFDYKLPLIYPELSVGGFVYMKRLSSSLFADFASLTGNYYNEGQIVGTFTSDISSYGIELTGDFHFLRFYAPVELGFRSSYLPEDGNVYFDFLFSINFNTL